MISKIKNPSLKKKIIIALTVLVIAVLSTFIGILIHLRLESETFPLEITIRNNNNTQPGDLYKFESSEGFCDLKINGTKVPCPIENMRWQALYDIPSYIIQQGNNSVKLKILKKREGFERDIYKPAISVQTASDFKILMGPIIGDTGTDYFTVTCVTNMKAETALEAEGKTYTGQGEYFHKFKAEGLKPETAYTYRLTAKSASTGTSISSGTFTVKTFPESNNFIFAVMGDSRSESDVWKEISEDILDNKPAFFVHNGDYVNNGHNFGEWVEKFWEPAKNLCASVPIYPIIGNHEEESPVLMKIFNTPEGKPNWSKKIGDVLIIGHDAYFKEKSFSAREWLENILKKSNEKFIFFAAHPPAWSSSSRGNNRKMQKLFGILEKHKATAMFAGHNHCYERSEPGNGTSMVVSATAGEAPKKKDPHPSNPYSKVYESKYNYLIINVDGDKCFMKAYTINEKKHTGKNENIIDSREWKARTKLEQ